MSNQQVNTSPIVKILYILSFITLSGHCLAIESELDLGNIYVIGSEHSESGLIESAVKTEILSADEISNGHFNDLSEAITEIPGVTKISVDRRSSAKTAMIQGFGENSVLVMIDGTPVSQNSAFGFDLSQISTENIEKVEVIKGGASALYGSQAIGGVINIITKKPTKQTKLNFDLSLANATESNSKTYNAKALYSGQQDGLGQKFSFSYRKQDESDLDDSTIAKDSAEILNYNAAFYIDKKLGSHLVFANYLHLKGEVSSTSSKPYGSSIFGPVINETDTKTNNYKLGHIVNRGERKFKTTLSLERINDRLNLNDLPNTYFKEMDKTTRYDAYRFDFKFDTIIADIHSLTAGFLYKQDKVNQATRTQQTEEVIVYQTDIDNKKVESFEAFAQDNIILDNYEISPGVRVQKDDSSNFTVNPKINLSYYSSLSKDLNNKAWLTIGTGHRSASIKERFFTLDHSSVGNYIVQGNENLLPEKSISLQLGDEISINKKTRVHANLFYNRIKNLIETTEIESPSSTRIFSYENISEVTSHGVEASANIFLNNSHKVKINYAYTEAIDKETELNLINRPLYIASFKHDFTPNSKHLLTTKLNYIGKKYTISNNTEVLPAYTTVDLKYNYRYSKNMDLYLGAKNLFSTTKNPASDTVIPVADDRPSLGRTIYTGLRINAL